MISVLILGAILVALKLAGRLQLRWHWVIALSLSPLLLIVAALLFYYAIAQSGYSSL